MVFKERRFHDSALTVVKDRLRIREAELRPWKSGLRKAYEKSLPSFDGGMALKLLSHHDVESGNV